MTQSCSLQSITHTQPGKKLLLKIQLIIDLHTAHSRVHEVDHTALSTAQSAKLYPPQNTALPSTNHCTSQHKRLHFPAHITALPSPTHWTAQGRLHSKRLVSDKPIWQPQYKHLCKLCRLLGSEESWESSGVQCTVYSLQCTLYSVQCIVYSGDAETVTMWRSDCRELARINQNYTGLAGK